MEERERLGGDLAPATAEPAPARARPVDLVFGAALLVAFTAIGAASAHVQSVVPGTVAGFLLLTVALALCERHRATHRAVARGLVPLSRLLLRHMGLLFVPAGVVGVDGLLHLPARAVAAVVAALLLSTLAGLAAAGVVTERARR